MKVLVVDDSSTMRLMFRRTLEEAFDAKVIEAEDVGDAFDKLAQHGDFDLIVTDLIMPGLSGASIVRKVRSSQPANGPAILVVSVDAAERSMIGELFEWGTDGFLRKPFTPEALAEKIRRILASRKGRPQRISRSVDPTL